MRGLNWKISFLSRVIKIYETNIKKKDYRASSPFILSTSYQQIFLFSLSASDPSPHRKACPKPASPSFLSHSSSCLFENNFFSVFYILNLYPHRKRFQPNFTPSDWEYMTITMANAEWHSVLNTSGKKTQNEIKKNPTNQAKNQPYTKKLLLN